MLQPGKVFVDFLQRPGLPSPFKRMGFLRRCEDHPRREANQVVALGTGDALQGLGPPGELRIVALDCGNFRRLSGQTVQEIERRGQAGRRALPIPFHALELVDRSSGEPRLPVEGGAPESAARDVEQHVQRVADAVERCGGVEDLGVTQFQQAPAEDHQVRGEVSTVHGGDVVRQHRLECPGVVPVEEMAAKPLHPLQRGQGVADALQQLVLGAVPEVVRGKIRKQRHSDIGWAGARRERRCRALLEIVWRKPVFLRRHEHLEIPPGSARHLAQEGSLVR